MQYAKTNNAENGIVVLANELAWWDFPKPHSIAYTLSGSLAIWMKT